MVGLLAESRSILLVAAIVLLAFRGTTEVLEMNGSSEGDHGRLWWYGTAEYATAEASMRLSAGEAHDLLVGKTRTHRKRYFDRTPIFIIGDKYFFTLPTKMSIPLTGFYVDGLTGQIEFRESTHSVRRSDDDLPADPFVRTEKVE